MYINRIVLLIILLTCLVNYGAVCESLNPATIVGDTSISYAYANSCRPKVIYSPSAQEYFVVWLNNENDRWNLCGRRISNSGEILSGIINITSTGSGGLFPSLASSDETGRLFLTYWNNTDLNVATLIDFTLGPTSYDQLTLIASGTFSVSQQGASVIKATDFDYYNNLDFDPSIKMACSGTELAMVIVQKTFASDAYENDILVARYDLSTTSFVKATINLGDGFSQKSYPQIKYNNGRFIATWRQQVNGEYYINSQIIDDSTISQVEKVNSPLAKSYSLVARGTNEGIFWHDYSEGKLAIFFKELTGTEKLLLPKTSGNDLLPSADSNGTTYSIVWESNEEGPYKIMFASYDHNSFEPYFKFERPFGEARNPNMIWGDNEYAMVWSDKRNPTSYENSWVIYFARMYAEGTKKAVGTR